MKYILTIISLVSFCSGVTAQCIANAGSNIHRCSTELTVQLGGSPTAFGGIPPYEYEWWIDPIPTSSQTLPYIYASDILNDTTIATPTLIYTGGSFIGDSMEFYLKITDELGCQSFDTIVLTTSHFGIHLIYHEYWINQGDSVYLNQAPNIGGGFGLLTYDWNPSYGLSDTTLASGFWASPDTSTAYTATVTDSKGCSATAGGPLYYIWVNTTGINEDNRIPTILYPNPTSNIIFIEADANKPIIKSEVYSLSGKKLANFANFRNMIDLSNYSNGTYILKLYFNDGISFRKIVKE